MSSLLFKGYTIDARTYRWVRISTYGPDRRRVSVTTHRPHSFLKRAARYAVIIGELKAAGIPLPDYVMTKAERRKAER